MHTPCRFFLPPLLLGLMLLGSFPAVAEKPDWAGKQGGKHDKHEKHERNPRDDTRPAARAPSSNVSVNIQIGGYFGETQRVAVREYYEPQFRAGNCPPGLAKKNNGCLPPGQAKKWRVGRPLPSDVVYYPVPSGVSVQIGLPPAGHKYVRVAADILLIAVGTGMVVDAIEDLGRL
jgi:Ni/Co efflux regulator RcnB